MHLKALIHSLTPVAVHIYFLRTTVCSPAIQYITCEAVIIKSASSGENSQEDDYIVVPLLFTQLSKSSGITCRLCCASFRYNRRFLSVSSQWFDTAAPKPYSSYFRSSPLSLCGISLWICHKSTLFFVAFISYISRVACGF